MKKDIGTLEKIGEIAVATIPVVGYYSGHSQGVKEGYIRASGEYEKKLRVLRERMQQIKRDVLGDNEIFIYPAGWDEEYWLGILSDFIMSFQGKMINAKELLCEFIDLCLKKFPQDKLAETCHQLRIIKDIILSAPADRITKNPGDLELTIHFLDVFGRPMNIGNDDSSENMKTLAKGLQKMRDEVKSAMCKINGCNFLILGKTGTGKSSLLNYLLGEKHFGVGVGKPVTGRGIWPYSAMIDSLKVTVYDSWGLESGDSFVDWHDMLNEEKQRHDLRQSVSEWFHSIIYCIQASGGRIEDVDIDVINSFLDEKYHIVVVFTKADLCSEDDEEILRNTLLKECPLLHKKAIISVCSEEKKYREGLHTTFGKEQLKAEIMTGYIGTIISQLPKRCVYLGIETLNEFYKKTTAAISKRSQWDDHNDWWLQSLCRDFTDNFNNHEFEKIIREQILECAVISQNLATAIDYNIPDDFSTSDFINDEDAWYEIAGKVALAIVAFPFVVITGLLAGNKWEREKLQHALDEFKEKTIKSISAQEDAVRKKLKEALGYDR